MTSLTSVGLTEPFSATSLCSASLPHTAQALERTKEQLADRSDRTKEQRAALISDEVAVFLGEVAEIPTCRKIFDLVISFFEVQKGLSKKEARHLLDMQLSFKHKLEFVSSLQTCIEDYQTFCGETPTPLEMATKLKNLQHLSVSYQYVPNKYTWRRTPESEKAADAVLYAFKHLPSITIEYAEDRELKLVAQLCAKTLRKLNLSGGKFLDLSPLASLPQLSSLALGYLKAIPRHIAVLSHLSNLTELSFSLELCKIDSWNKASSMTNQEAEELSLLETLPRLTKLGIRACSTDCQTPSPYEKFLVPLKIWCLIRKVSFELLAQAGYKDEVQVATLRTLQKALFKKTEPMLLREPVKNPPTEDELVKFLQNLKFNDKDSHNIVMSFFGADEIAEPKELYNAFFSELLSQKKASKLSYTAIQTFRNNFHQLFLRAPNVFPHGVFPRRFSASHFVLGHLAENRENVKTLTCSGTNIDDSALEGLLKLFSEIHTLDLNGCARLTDATLKNLQTLPLMELNIMGTQIRIPSDTPDFPKLMFLKQSGQRFSQDVSTQNQKAILIDYFFQESAPLVHAVFARLSKETKKELFDMLDLNSTIEDHKFDKFMPLLVDVLHSLKPHLPKAWF